MDDNRIIIDSANFNRNMPKWATEDTLNRLERMIGNSNKESQKSLKDVVRLLKTLSDKDSDLFKETQKSNRDQTKELEKITKVLSKSSSTTDTTTSKDIKDSTKKTNDVLSKGFNSVTSSTEKMITSILNGNSDVSSKLNEANKTHDKVSEQLVKIHEELKNIGSGNNTSTNTGKTNDRSNINVDNEETNSILGDIKSLLGKQNSTQNRILERTVSGDQFDDMMTRNSRKITDEYREAARANRGSLKDMFESASESVSGQNKGSIASEALNRTIGSLTGVVSNLRHVLKTTAIGKLATIAGAVYAAATKTFEYAYDAQDQFRDMVDRGFNFSGLSDEVGGDRLDGISMRASITRNDIGLETATQILEKNTRLINEVGLSSMFTELGNIVGDIDDPNSVTNRLGMTRDQVALIATDFYSMHRRINTITRDMSRLDRQRLAERFTENVRKMSQQLGVGLPEVREAIDQFTKTGTFTRTSTFMDTEQSGNLAMLAGAMGATDIPQQIQEAIITASSSIAGGMDPSIVQQFGQSPQFMELFRDFDQQFRGMRDMDAGDQANVLQDFVTRAQQIIERREGQIAEGMSLDLTQRQHLDMFSQMISSMQQLSRDDILQGGQDVSPIAKLQRELTNMGLLIDARTEDVFAQAADSEAGREMLYNILSVDDVMKRTQIKLLEYADDMTQALFNGPIPTVLRQIKRVIEGISKGLDFFIGRDHDEKIEKSGADQLLGNLERSILGSESFNTIFETSEGEDGKTVYNIKEGIGSEELNEYFTGMYESADSREDREAIAGLVKSLSRGVEGRQRRLDDDSQRLFSSMEELFLGNAATITSGDERDKLLSVFDGIENSVELLGARVENNLNTNSSSVAGLSTDEFKKLGDLHSDTATVVINNQEELNKQLTNKMERNLADDAFKQEQANQRRQRQIQQTIQTGWQAWKVFGDDTLPKTRNRDDGRETTINDIMPSFESLKNIIRTVTPAIEDARNSRTLERGNRDSNVEFLPYGDDVTTLDDYNRKLDELSSERYVDSSAAELLAQQDSNRQMSQQQQSDDTTQYQDDTVKPRANIREEQRQKQDAVMLALGSRPERLENDNAIYQDLIEQQKRQEQNRQYSEQVSNNEVASNNGFNVINQNTEENNTINNDQLNSNLAQTLAELQLSNSRIAESVDGNTRALNKYLSKQV